MRRRIGGRGDAAWDDDPRGIIRMSPAGDLDGRDSAIGPHPTSAPAFADVSDDAGVVAAVLGGDREAFRLLVDREAASVVRACHRVLGDLAEAEDVAQEAFVIAYRSLASWRGEGPFGAWLARIAVRLAVRAARRRKSVPWVRAIGPDGEGEHPAERLHAGAGSDPEGLALRGERIATLRAAVAALDEPYREVVALRFFGERSLEEIASATGRPLGTVKTHLHRGLLRLRTAMSPGSAR